MKCPRCGNESNGNFCENCGMKMEGGFSKKEESYRYINKDPKTYTYEEMSNPNKKKGGCLKIILIVFAVFCGLIFLLSMFSGNDSSDNKIDQKEKTPLEEKGYIEAGESFTVDNLKITFEESSTDFKDYEDEYEIKSPSDGMKYIMASFTYENIGSDGDEYASIYDFDCFADDSNCEQTFIIDDKDFVNTNLSPGRNVSFKVYFEVPSDSKSIELEYKESMWNDNRIKIKLQ